MPMKTFWIISTLTLVFVSASTSFAAGERIDWDVISGGGEFASQGNHQLDGTVGQTSVELFSDGDYRLSSGFWQQFSNPLICCNDVLGNVNCGADHAIDIEDLTVLIDHMFISLEALCCLQEADFDFSDAIDIQDLQIFIDHLFISLNPYPACD